MTKINQKQNIFNDNIAFVEQYDFSTANMSEDSRIKAITTVASVCYHNDKVIDKESLYNRLATEAKGLPSSSFEFVPVLLTVSEVSDVLLQLDSEEIVECFDSGQKVINNVVTSDVPIIKYGEWVEYDGNKYLITNFRAITSLYEIYAIDLRDRYNTLEECEIIKQHFKVFLYKVDLPTRSQMVRHRVSWQELSRRYVSGERVPFEFYISDKMKEVQSDILKDNSTIYYIMKTKPLINACLNHYKEALKQGVKPQEARRIIPQAAYTQIWGAFMPKQLDNYFKLRLDGYSQWEIRQTAIAMQELINDKVGIETYV